MLEPPAQRYRSVLFLWPLTAPAVVTARGCEKTDEPGFLVANTGNSDFSLRTRATPRGRARAAGQARKRMAQTAARRAAPKRMAQTAAKRAAPKRT